MTHRAVDLYEEAYATEDASQVDRLVREAFTADASFESAYVVQPLVGIQALADHIRHTRDRLAGTTSRRTSPIERVGNTLRWTWVFEADGAVVAEGTDVVVLDDDERISRFVVFDGTVPSG